MKILVAGATGAIGRVLVPLLVEGGHEVAGTTRHPERAGQIAAMGAEGVVMDALDRASVFSAVERVRPEIVMHMLTDLAGRDFAANTRLRIEGTRNLVDAALACGVGRVIAESIAWIYVPGKEPAREEEPLDLHAGGSRGRMVQAVEVMEGAVAEVPVGVSLRYGLLYGPGTWYSPDGLTTEEIRRREQTASDAVTSFLHVADAASAAVTALRWPAGPVNIVDDEPASGREWVPLYARLVGAPPPPEREGREGWERGASNAKARALGWRPAYPTWRDGFREVLQGDADAG